MTECFSNISNGFVVNFASSLLWVG